ncbi:hypothetical protein M569_16381, partial [Genlisea aurea]
KTNKFLIVINVLGSSGPVRFLVRVEDNVKTVIENALKVYRREGRIPVIGTDSDDFLLYPAHNGFKPVDVCAEIGSCGGQKFVLCKKQKGGCMTTEGRTQSVSYRKGNNKFSAWLKKSLSLKILS